MINYKKLGQFCKEFRIDFLKMTQKEIADELDLTVSSISMFENGNSRSPDILLYYMTKGFPVHLLEEIWSD